MQDETPQELAWRNEFAAWSESALRTFAEPSRTSWEYDARKNVARIVLAERAEERQEAREARTLRVAMFASVVAWIAVVLAIIAIVLSILK
jgi:hypothetical protein